jgi:hypothetical protein
MKPLPRTEGEVQCWEHNCEAYVKADDYAALNEHSALVEMNLQAENATLVKALAHERVRNGELRSRIAEARDILEGLLGCDISSRDYRAIKAWLAETTPNAGDGRS